MEWLTLLSIGACFVIVINRIRKQDRELARQLSVYDERIKRLEIYSGLNKLPADTDLTADPLSAKICRLEKFYYDNIGNGSSNRGDD